MARAARTASLFTPRSRVAAIPPPRLYGDLAWLWPILSPPEHYVEEAATLSEGFEARRGQARGGRPRLLDLGAGGGHVLSHLAPRFDCTAVDRSLAMLDNLARLVPEAERVQADLRQVRLGRRFDLVLLHDAVDYMRNSEDVDRALATARAHLAPGGVVFVAPTYTRESFVDGELADERDEDSGVTYVTFVHDADPDDSEYEMILVYFLRHAQSREVRVVEDRHRCGLFSEEQWLQALARAGLRGERLEDEKAWTLFAATERPTGRIP